MKLENQVCSLELAKKIKELRVKQEPFTFCWHKNNKADSVILFKGDGTDILLDGNREWVRAFTVAELGEILPDKKYDHQMWRFIWEWEVKGFSEADARAKMLIYLMENKQIEA